MIADWRVGFAQPDLPFIIYQISPNRKPQNDPNENSGIAVLQEAQLKTSLATPHTALVVTMDLGETNVHYLNKEPAGERGMKAALGIAYGRKIEFSSPVFKSVRFDGDKAIVQFHHAGGGLVAKGGPLSGFVIAGGDHKFVFADARIEGETVIVSSPQVSKPVAVRYGWADFPKANLFSKEGLPASPFRTDDWRN
jgi:sialate O-acetylesterase